MFHSQLHIPSSLIELIENGVWPNSLESQRKQRLNPKIAKEDVKKISPEDDCIELMRHPFHTIQDEVDGGNEFWTTYLSNVGEIEYDKALIIADFGLGSDSPIILYYKESISPTVMYLKWSGNGKNISHSWVQTHSSFEKFAADVGIIDA